MNRTHRTGKTLLAALTLITLAGCQLAAQDNRVPARLAPEVEKTTPHPLTAIVSYMLNGAKVTLANEAFYNNSEVIIEGPKLGRTFEKPNRFRLWLKDSNCLLEHVESGAEFDVHGVPCVAVETIKAP